MCIFLSLCFVFYGRSGYISVQSCCRRVNRTWIKGRILTKKLFRLFQPENIFQIHLEDILIWNQVIPKSKRGSMPILISFLSRKSHCRKCAACHSVSLYMFLWLACLRICMLYIAELLSLQLVLVYWKLILRKWSCNGFCTFAIVSHKIVCPRVCLVTLVTFGACAGVLANLSEQMSMQSVHVGDSGLIERYWEHVLEPFEPIREWYYGHIII